MSDYTMYLTSEHLSFVPSRMSERLKYHLKNMGGRPSKLGTEYHFPPLAMYALSLLRRFPSTEIHESARPLFDNPWGFPSPVEDRTWDPRLFRYQQRAIEYLVSNPHKGSLLALSPGLGKTAVAVSAADVLNASKILVVCPLSLLKTWEREIKLWSKNPGTIEIAYGVVPHENARWTISNYDTVVRKSGSFSTRYDIVIIDESILVKNRKTRRVSLLRPICMRAWKVWLLSGAPISKYVDDLWSQFNLMMPRYFSSYWRFVNEYVETTSSPWGIEFLGSKPLNFRSEFADIMLSVNQEDVLDLPELLPETIEVEMNPDQAKAYREIYQAFMTQLSSGEELLVSTKVAQISILHQIASDLVNVDTLRTSSAKSDAILELLEAQHWEFPMLIWTHWVEGARYLLDRLIRANYSTGFVFQTTRDREGELQKFRDGQYDIMLMSIGVGKFGFTLTNVKTAIYYDKTFAFDDYYQSLHRIKRIGLKHSPVVTSLMAANSIDYLVEQNLRDKSLNLNQLTNADLKNLLSGLGG